MCVFNTLLLPASVPIEAVNAIAREILGQTFTTQGNVALERAVAAEARSYVREGSCDCGAGLAGRRPAKHDATERELRKLRANGWSDAKIQRWVAQRTATEQRHAQPSRAGEWATFVGRLLDEPRATWVGLFTHDYHGAVRTECIEMRDVRRFVGVTIDQVSMIEEDVAFVFASAR